MECSGQLDDTDSWSWDSIAVEPGFWPLCFLVKDLFLSLQIRSGSTLVTSQLLYTVACPLHVAFQQGQDLHRFPNSKVASIASTS